MKVAMDAYLGYFRLPYNLIVVIICAVLYLKCILKLYHSRIDRMKLLTFAFAANLLSWVVTVLPHLVFIDFVLRKDKMEPYEFFIMKFHQQYVGILQEYNGEKYNKGALLLHNK